MCYPQANCLATTLVVTSFNVNDIKETLVKEHLRTIFFCIKQSSFNLINSKKNSALLLY